MRMLWPPGLVLRIFLALLPWLLAIMGRVQGLYSQSMLDFSVVTKYYVFQARSQLGAVSCDWAPVPRACRISSMFYLCVASVSAANLHISRIVYSGCGPFLNEPSACKFIAHHGCAVRMRL